MGNSVVQKDVLAQYVHDAVEMEANIYTLKEMEKECENQKAKFVDESKEYWNMYENAEEDRDHCIEWLANPIGCAQYRAAPKASKYFSDTIELIKFVLILALYSLIPCLIIIVMASAFYSVISGAEMLSVKGVLLTELFLVVGVCLICGVISSVNSAITYKKDLSRYKKECIEIDESNYEEYKEAYEESKQSVDKYLNQYNGALKQSALLDIQITDTREKCRQMEKNLENFYSYGLIPPDYRTFDCEVILDQIFRNDLADTMREAIKIYEERVFRGSVIRGMDKICSMLGQLSSDMAAISLRLDMIDSSVAQMSDDLSRANERMIRNQRELIDQSIRNQAATEDLIKETQLGRYTNEKLLESNKRLEYYAEEYRMGRMPIK